MNITLQGTNLDLSDDLRQFVDDKVHDCFHAFGDMNLDPVQVDVELERTTNHHRKGDALYRAEANVSVPGRIIRAEETAADVNAAIVEMKRTLTREIRKWRERLIDERRQGAREAKHILQGRNEE